MDFLLLDSWDSAIREIQPGGYSQVVRRGAWELDRLPRCPHCGKDIWSLAVKYPFGVEFTGERIGDIAYGFATTLVVSARFRELWRASGLAGLMFSDGPVAAKFKKKAEFHTPSREFFAAYPEPELVRLPGQSGATYAEQPECSMCSVGVVDSIDQVVFDADDPLTDFFLPSALPGWFAVSRRVCSFVEENQLKNFQFIERFSRQEWHLIRHGYWQLGVDGRLERSESVSFPAHL